MYPHETGEPGEFHYFVQYRHRESAERALHLKLGSSAGLRVYPIHSDLSLVEQFRSCRPYGLLRQLPKRGTLSLAPTNYLELGAKGKQKDPLEGRPSDLAALDRTRSSLENRHGYPSLPRPTSASLPRRPSTPKMPHICRTNSDPNTGVDKQTSLDTSPASFSLDSRLILDIQGQKITYDLAKDPEQNPKLVIELLKLSSSERGNWMVAGAHFRRIGKPHAAIDIMHAMIEGAELPGQDQYSNPLTHSIALVTNGFTEAKLKPVFLLLSGCELDLAIYTRDSGDLAASQQHYVNVNMWLQKVYGTSLPATSDQQPSSLLSSTASCDQAPLEPPRSKPTMKVDFRPPSNTSRNTTSYKRKIERYPSDERERNVRRCSSGPPKLARKSSAKGWYSASRESWRRS